MREKFIPQEQFNQNEFLPKDEEERQNFNEKEIASMEDKETGSYISRLKFGWEKIKEKVKESLKKNTKRAVVLSSIAFTMLSASEGMALSRQELQEMFGKETKKHELVLGEEKLRELESENYGDLFRYADEVGVEIESQRITNEFNLLNSVSEVLNEKYKLQTGDAGNFDFAERGYNKIKEANENFEKILNFDNEDDKRKFKTKIFEQGRINWKNLIETFPMVWTSTRVALIAHELGHLEEAIKQDAETGGIKVKLGFSKQMGSASLDSNKAKTPEKIHSAGINQTSKVSQFIIEGLRGREQNDQILAILALIMRCDGAQYSIRSKLGLGQPENDITAYSLKTGIPVEQLYIGLIGDFLLSSDNWKLVKMATGDESVKLSDKFWQCYYKLAEGGPEIGVKGGFKF